MNVLGLKTFVELRLDRLGLGDFFRLEPVLRQHVEKIGVAAGVELIGAVERNPPIAEQPGQRAVDDGGPDLALDVVADDRQPGLAEARRPSRIGGNEHRHAIDHRDAGGEAGLGVVADRLLGPDRHITDQYLGTAVAQ